MLGGSQAIEHRGDDAVAAFTVEPEGTSERDVDVAFESFAQQGAEEARADRRDGNIQARRCLFHAQLLQRAQHEHRPER